MTYQHFIIIRFSIKVSKAQWKNPIREWDHNRLDNRFFLFENICLPSLINQKMEKNTRVILLVSYDLPSKYLKRLKYLEKKHKFIRIEKVTDQMVHNKLNFLKKYTWDATRTVATTRLDDDDALHPLFVQQVLTHMKNTKAEDYFITFPSGYWLNLDQRTKKATYLPCYKRFIACGLTRVTNIANDTDMDKYSVYFGNHNTVGKLGLKIINDKSIRMYSVTNHSFNDSGRRLNAFIRNPKNKPIDGEYKQKFPFINPDKLFNDPVEKI